MGGPRCPCFHALRMSRSGPPGRRVPCRWSAVFAVVTARGRSAAREPRKAGRHRPLGQRLAPGMLLKSRRRCFVSSHIVFLNFTVSRFLIYMCKIRWTGFACLPHPCVHAGSQPVACSRIGARGHPPVQWHVSGAARELSSEQATSASCLTLACRRRPLNNTC